jgi:hypothetical protein
MKKHVVPALILCLGLASGRLSGQSYRTFADESNDIRARAGFAMGPIKIVPSLLAMNIGYDSNVLYRDAEEGPVSDTVATFAPQLQAFWLLGRSVILSFTDVPSYYYYVHEEGLRTLSNSAVPAARILLGRLSLSGNYHLLNDQKRGSSEIAEPVLDTQEGWNARAFIETPRGTALGVSATVDDFRFRTAGSSSPLDSYGRTLDRRERALSFEFYYRVFSQSHLFVTAEASDCVFAHPTSAWRNADSQQVYGGIRFPVGGQAARGTIALGYKRFVPRTADRQEFSGLVADTDVTFRTGRLGLNLAYKRDNYFSYIETAYYFIEDRFRTGLTFYLFQFLRLEGSWQAATWNYPEPYTVWVDGQPTVIEGRRDQDRVFAAGLAFRVAGTVGLGLSYNFYRRRSNAPGFDIDRNYLGLNLAYDF